MPTVSVIMPAYNQARYLGEAVRSVLGQDFGDFELIVVDDGSTDDTPSVAEGVRDGRVRYIRQANRGLSGARNTGLRHASGALVTFLDSDDLFTPRNLSVLVSALAEHPQAGLVRGGTTFVGEDGAALAAARPPQPPQPPLTGGPELLLGNRMAVGSQLLHRAWLDRVGFFDEGLRACEDWDMWLRLARAGCGMASVAQTVFLYRTHAGQMTRGAARMRQAMLAVLDKTFAAPDLPASWRAMRDKAYAAAYVRAAARAYHAAEYADAQRDLTEAIRLDPALLDGGGHALADQMSGWADAPLGPDPLVYLERVYGHLPAGVPLLRRNRRRELARKAQQLAFESYREGSLGRARDLFLRAFLYRPASLLSRGTLSVCARSFFGSSLGS